MRLFNKLLNPTSKPFLRTTTIIRMLGSEYDFKIKEGKRNSATIIDSTIHVTLHTPTKSNFVIFINSWYKRKAHKLYKELIDGYMDDFKRLEYTIPLPRIKIYKMYKAWGRCYYTRDVITINSKLMRLPLDCVKYIILHEMTHFVAHDHGVLFQAILDKIDPLWRGKESILRRSELNKAIMR